MKLSTKGKYGLEAMVDLAVHTSEGPISLKSISARQNLPENYLEQIFLVLRRSELVSSIRGAQGGYLLAKPAEKISVLEVLNALEGPLAPVSCIIEGNSGTCARYARCASRTLWEKVKALLDTTASSITLGELVDKYRAANQADNQIEYYI
jgi:Rrf2 family transcriptional regulator, cysteine metabolism repressor